jgi:hypothetical protein
LLWGKGVYQGNPTPGKSSVHIFSQEYATVLFCGYCENQRIPDLEFMIHIQIQRSLKCGPGGVRYTEGICPAQYR